MLPLTLLCYRPLRFRRKATASDDSDEHEEHEVPAGNPTLVDWLLAAMALVACLYPVLPFVIAGGGGGFDEFLVGRARRRCSMSSSGRSC